MDACEPTGRLPAGALSPRPARKCRRAELGRVSHTLKTLVTSLVLTAGLTVITSGSRRVDAAAHPEPLEVLVNPVQQGDVPIYKEWIGQPHTGRN